jgi:predicted RNA-binding Zn ribbon-like protein
MAARRGQGPFFFHHGSVALSFAGTLGNRGSAEPLERVPDAAALRAWLSEAGLLARVRTEIDESIYRRSIELRETIWRIAAALERGRKPARADIDALNEAVKRWSPAPRLDPATLRLEAREGQDPVRSALGRVAVDALELFGDPARRDRLRACEDAGCSALFLDPGRGRPRLWCSMARCGNRAKVAAYRARRLGG